MSRSTRLARCARLALERLDDRAVPAILVDVSYAGASGTANGALFYQGDQSPADAGPTFAFLRLQGWGVERGYNTDARPVQFNASRDPLATRALTLGQVPVVTVDGVDYREFLVGVNQLGFWCGGRLSLDELRIYAGPTGNLSGYSPVARTLAGQAALFDLDGAGNVTVKMADRLVPLGEWDVRVLVPDAAFAGLGVDDHVYLFSKFGGRYAATGGAEVWATRPARPTPGPGTNTGSLSGYVYADMDGDGVREPDGNEFMVPEYGLEGVAIHLTGTDVRGNSVDLWATTDANGYYEFTGLAAGTYTITRPEFAPDSPFWDGLNHVGTAGGTSNESNTEPDVNGPDMIYDIGLDRREGGTEYNFGMLGG